MARETKKEAVAPGVKLESLHFYFDSVERDRMDAAGWDRRSGEVLALRERLLKMPAPDFEATIKTIRNIVQDAGQSDPKSERDENARRRRQASALFDQVPSAMGSSSSRVDKITN